MARKSKEAAAQTNVNPDDEAACYSEYEDLRGESARVGQRIAKTLERYKKLGVDTSAIKFAYAESQKEDATARHRSRTALMARLAVIEWEWEDSGQGSFGSGLDIGKMSTEGAGLVSRGRAKSAGYKAGNTGVPHEPNPYEPGTQEHVLWLEQWHAGFAVRQADGKGDVVKATPRSRKKVSELEGATIN